MPNKHLPECPTLSVSSGSCNCEVDGVFCRCIECRRNFSFEQLHVDGVAADRCPECGTQTDPMHPLDDVDVKINWFELRVLAQWAEQWAARHARQYPHMQSALYAITQALEEQCPSFQPLTAAMIFAALLFCSRASSG